MQMGNKSRTFAHQTHLSECVEVSKFDLLEGKKITYSNEVDAPVADYMMRRGQLDASPGVSKPKNFVVLKKSKRSSSMMTQ